MAVLVEEGSFGVSFGVASAVETFTDILQAISSTRGKYSPSTITILIFIPNVVSVLKTTCINKTNKKVSIKYYTAFYFKTGQHLIPL